MRSRKPYLLRAIHEWICDCGMTPHALVDCNQPGVQVPPEVIKDGQVVLNLSPMAVHNLTLTNELVGFSARFGGQVPQVSFPEGLAATVDWYRRNEAWWRPIKEQDPAYQAYHHAQYVTRG